MDILTLSIAVGLFTSLAFTELCGLAVGGMIVPGYFALCLDQPLCVVATIVAALITLGAVKLLSKMMIVYGRRRVVLTIIVGFIVGALLRQAAVLMAAPISPDNPEYATAMFSVVGFIIPGLIALWMDRQGIVDTLAPLMMSVVVVRLTLVIMGMEVYA